MNKSTEFSIDSLLAEARARQREKWSRAEQVSIEELLLEFPQLADNEDHLLELIYAEYCLRLRHDDPFESSEYFDRFPQVTDRLRVIFQVHAVMEESTVSPTLQSNLDDTRGNLKARHQAAVDEDEFPTFAAKLGSILPLQSSLALDMDDYELIDVLGHGGMGIVYKARQTSANRMVALKMIRSAQLASPEELRRFQQEVEAAAGLDHPNIVPIYQVGITEGQPYFSMALVNGPTLAARATANPLETHEAVGLVRDAANAIQYAHENGIVHRDLKPANLMLTHNGELKITDFGLAKHIDAEEGHTQSGSVLGTPSYMSPEQATGDVSQIGPASDIYSLGAILYFLLTGRPPFQSANVIDILLQVISDEPVLVRQLNPTVPRDLETVVVKCLQKDPAKRYKTAGKLVEELDRILEGVPVLARPVSSSERAWRWCRRNRVTATLAATSAALLVVMMTFLTVSLLRQVRLKDSAISDKLTAELSELNLRIEKERADANAKVAESNADVARQRLYIVSMNQAQNAWYDGNVGRQLELLNRYKPTPGQVAQPQFEWNYLQRLCSSNVLEIPFAGPAWDACYSPDGEWLAAASTGDNSIGIWDADTGDLLHAWQLPSGATDVSFSPDGGQLASASPDGSVGIWNPETGEEILQLVDPAGSPETTGRASLCYDTDGARLVTGRRNDNSIRVWDSISGELLTTLAATSTDVRRVRFGPNDKLVIAAVEDAVEIWSLENEQRIFTVRPTFAPIIPRMDLAENRTVKLLPGKPLVNDILLTRSGKLTAVRDDGWSDAYGGNSVSPIMSTRNHLAATNNFALNPDGSAMITASDDRTIRAQLRPARALSVNQLVLRGHLGRVSSACFHPNGYIVASTTRDVGTDEVIRTWDLRGRAEYYSAIDQSQPPGPFAIANQRGWLVTASWNNSQRANSTLTFHRLDNQLPRESNLLFELTPAAEETEAIEQLTFSADEKLLAVACANGVVKLVDLEERSIKHRWTTTASSTALLAFHPNGRQLVLLNRQGTVSLLDSTTGEELEVEQDMAPADSVVQAASMVPGDHHLLVVTNNGTVLTLDLDNRELSEHPKRLTAEIRSLALSGDGQQLAIGTASPTVLLYQADNLDLLRQLEGHKGATLGLSFSADGKRLLSASSDSTIKLWDIASGQELIALKDHVGAVNAVQFSRNGQWVVSSSVDGTVRLWDGRP